MGVEYRHFLIPAENDYRPTPGEAARLVAALVEARFASRGVVDPAADTRADEALEGPGCVLSRADGDRRAWPSPFEAEDLAQLGETDLRLTWDVERLGGSGLIYPMAELPDEDGAGPEEAYYALEIHLADDFVYETSETIDPFWDVACCGEALDDGQAEGQAGLPPLFGPSIRRTCPRCGRAFRPQDHVAIVRDGRTGKTAERPGGATYRFAVSVDCGKCFPRSGAAVAMNRDLVAIVERTLGRSFYEVGTFS